jgi:hypothetical protein
MRRRSLCTNRVPIVILAAAALVAFGFVPSAQAQPVTVSVTVSGTATPGATVSATAAVEITDGSTLQSISWSQVEGAEAVLSGTTTDTVTIQLADEDAYRAYLFHVLAEPPIGADQLPPNVPVPPGEFPGGVQDRFGLLGTNPFALEHAAAVMLEVEVVTTSGTYSGEGEVVTTLPWRSVSGIQNVALNVPVLLHGKDQASYDWTLTAPAGSSAGLRGATTKTPEFTPDVAGKYDVKVTDEASGSQVTIPIYAGTWRGIIVGQDADGRPIPDEACTTCHNGTFAADKFTPWAKTGHAEIFTQNVDTPNGHYGTGCITCHTVGYDPDAVNGGIDDNPDWQAFLDSNLLTHGDPDNWTQILAQFPDIAKQANIQCENCHGPQNTNAHSLGGVRGTLSSEMCGVCHGEPARHGRYQQWQLSGHANYEVARAEGTNGTCAKCHSANGFLEWLPILMGEVPGDPDANIPITWTADEVHPQTCQTCHDPHAIGTTSSSADTNATVRISGDSPMLMAGFVATDVGRGAICITCHNTRRGLRNDATFTRADAARAPHLGAQGDVLMGQNAYFVEVGKRSFHSRVEDACVACHMEKTPPPADLSYQLGGTNHTFYASPTICSKCHSVVKAEDVQGPFEEKMAELKASIEASLLRLIQEQISLGKTVDLAGSGTITDASTIASISFEESHGQQGIAVTFTDSSVVGPVAMGSVKAQSTVGGPAVALYNLADESLPKAGWNYSLLESDKSEGVHNPSWTAGVIEASLTALTNAARPGGIGASGGIGAGEVHPGDGSGAVTCTTPYVYWTEIAAHSSGLNNSVWRTDMVTRNMAQSAASVEFVLHTGSGTTTASGAVDPSAQGVFEDIVGQMGLSDKGAVEICSNQPLEVASRVFNTSDAGTFGQFINGYAGGAGLTVGQVARLIGLREAAGAFRSNISVTNTGLVPGEVAVTLWSSTGTPIITYTLSVGSGMVVQDVQPFANRAGQPNIGWGYATVEVISGNGILTSASVIDAKTNDATTVPMKP